MGMDVIGRNPASDQGEYFRNNAWWWGSLADYCMEIAPDVTARCKYWHSNDGDGLSDRDSGALADALQKEIESGRCEAHAKAVEAAASSERCIVCEGSGVSMPIPKVGASDAVTDIKCWACGGDGRVFSEYFSVENVQEFVTFLRDSGGFNIW
jgi:hypothetical protein